MDKVAFMLMLCETLFRLPDIQNKLSRNYVRDSLFSNFFRIFSIFTKFFHAEKVLFVEELSDEYVYDFR